MTTQRSARPLRAAAETVAALAGIVAPATAAQAAPAPPAPDGTGTTATAPHCIADLDDGTRRCFDTFRAAVERATEGRIDDAPATARLAAQDGEFRESVADGVIQGTFFEHDAFGGASLTVYGPEPCEKDGWVDFQYDLPGDWQDRISSVQPWADCWIWLYPEPGLGGDRDGPFKENAPDIGSYMNDRARSIGFS